MPLPRPDHDTQPFWDGAREGRFLVPRCDGCGKGHWPPGPACPWCHGAALSWGDAPARGTVYSWVVATHPVAEVLADQVPYAIALIDLEPGVRVVGNVLGCDPADVRAGLEVEIVYETREEGVVVPNFQVPAGS